MYEDISSMQSCVPLMEQDAILVCPWCRGITQTSESENDSYICSNCGTTISQDDLDTNNDQL